MFSDTTERIWKFCTMIPKQFPLPLLSSYRCCIFFQTEARRTSLKTVTMMTKQNISIQVWQRAQSRPMGNCRQISNNLQTNVCCQSGSLQYFLEYVIRLIKKVPANSLTFNSLPSPSFCALSFPKQCNAGHKQSSLTNIPQYSPL